MVRWYRPKLGSSPEAIATQFANLSISALRGAEFNMDYKSTTKKGARRSKGDGRRNQRATVDD
jgi:hypothetical protein